MQDSRELKFESPSFVKRLKGMLGVDFYRLFHTPLFYIFLAIAAIIPAMILGSSGFSAICCIKYSRICQYEYGIYIRWNYGVNIHWSRL